MVGKGLKRRAKDVLARMDQIQNEKEMWKKFGNVDIAITRDHNDEARM